ncbi:MAG: hypothetical protein RLZZ436_4127 [Planctomycetota bacterium]
MNFHRQGPKHELSSHHQPVHQREIISSTLRPSSTPFAVPLKSPVGKSRHGPKIPTNQRPPNATSPQTPQQTCHPTHHRDGKSAAGYASPPVTAAASKARARHHSRTHFKRLFTQPDCNGPRRQRSSRGRTSISIPGRNNSGKSSRRRSSSGTHSRECSAAVCSTISMADLHP